MTHHDHSQTHIQQQLRERATGQQSHEVNAADEERKPAERIHYFDNLRALAMLLGLFLHAGLAYADPAQNIWLATDRQSSRLIDIAIWFVHLFRMALFFLISGYFAKLLVARRGVKGFLINRVVRVAIPFLVFWPILLIAMGAVFFFGFSFVDPAAGMMGLIQQAAKTTDAPAPTSVSTMHLWFLYYLFMFSLVTAALVRFDWRHLKVPNRKWLFSKQWLLTLAPLLLVPGTIAGNFPMVAPESFVPAWWPFAFYGIFYWAGWKLREHEHEVLDRLQSWWLPLAVVCGLGFATYYLLLPELSISSLAELRNPPQPASRQLLLLGLLGAYLSTILVAFSLLLGRKYLASRSVIMRVISDASYWTYLIHLPIVLFLQTLLIEVSLNVWLKLMIVISATLFVSLTTYVVFVRYTPVGWLLNGKREFP
jgi:glucans biosynthesis protein C